MGHGSRLVSSKSNKSNKSGKSGRAATKSNNSGNNPHTASVKERSLVRSPHLESPSRASTAPPLEDSNSGNELNAAPVKKGSSPRNVFLELPSRSKKPNKRSKSGPLFTQQKSNLRDKLSGSPMEKSSFFPSPPLTPGQSTKSHNRSSQTLKDVNCLLNYVRLNRVFEAEKMVEKNVGLLREEGSIGDRTGVTPLQYAKLTLNVNMCEMFLFHISSADALKQLTKLKNIHGSEGQNYGKPFDYSFLIQARDDSRKHYKAGNLLKLKECCEVTMKKTLEVLPAHAMHLRAYISTLVDSPDPAERLFKAMIVFVESTDQLISYLIRCTSWLEERELDLKDFDKSSTQLQESRSADLVW